jgi:hypothetical protein
VARYRRFAEMCPEHELVLLEFGRTSRVYGWTPSWDDVPYRRVVLSEQPIEHHRPRKRIAMISSALNKLKPDLLVVCGYGVPGMVSALHWTQGLVKKVPSILLSDSTAEDAPRSRWREGIKRRVVARCAAAFVAGRRQRDYMTSLGLPAERIFSGYDVVDNGYFEASTDSRRAGVRPAFIPDRPFFLASSRFVPEKNLVRLLEAFACYRKNAGPLGWDLVLLGDGVLRSQLEKRRDQLMLESAVLMPGFKQYGDLPDYYAWAGAFVHCSTSEPWGLVVNEAMAAGLPVLVSQRCGCVPDLLEDGKNGFTFDPCDVQTLARLMLKISSDDCDRAAMGRASQEIIRRWTPEVFARSLQQAIDLAVASPQPNAHLIDKALLWMLSHR